MSAKELIKALKRLPPNSEIGWQDHDSSEGELSARINGLHEFIPDGSQDSKWTDGITHILRP